jgi:hypothetical protein
MSLLQKVMAPGSPLRNFRKVYKRQSRHFREISRKFKAATNGALEKSLASPAQSLKEKGYAPWSDHMSPSKLAKVLELTQELTGRLDPSSQAQAGKNYWQKLVKNDELSTSHPLVEVCLDDSLLKVISAYFGEAPCLGSVELLASFGTDNPAWIESQLWHRDYADSKTVKLFIYLTDVQSEADGPFAFYPLEKSRYVREGLFPSRVADNKMPDFGLSAQDRVAILGQRGSSFLIDTANCYHHGSRLEKGHLRLAYVATFITHASLYPFAQKIKDDPSAPLSDLAQLALARETSNP